MFPRTGVITDEKQKITIDKALKTFYNKLKQSVTELQIIPSHDLMGAFQMPGKAISSITQLPIEKLALWWGCDEEDYEIWWEYEYDEGIKTLLIVSYFTHNCRTSHVKGLFNINLFTGLFEKYNRILQSQKLFLQYNINPITGNVKILNKVFVHTDQLINELANPAYIYQIVRMMRSMTSLCKQMIQIELYSEGRVPQCPIPSFVTSIEQNNQKDKKQGVSPQVFLGAIFTAMTSVDTNGEESLQSFATSENMIEYYLANEHEFPSQMMNIIKILKGKITQKQCIQLSDIINEIYDVSFANQVDEGENLALKIRIITDSNEIEWKPVAKGGFGFIEKAYVNYELFEFGSSNGRKVEGYIVRKSDTKLSKIPHEHKIFRLLQNEYHANIMSHYLPEQSIYSKFIFSKFEPNLSLEKYLKTNKKTISIQTIIRFLQHSVKGLMFLKQKNIVHLDIKPNNIIITKDLKAKISDFGQAFFKEDEVLQHKHGYTIPYIPAEVFYPEPYFNSKVDVYAIGVTMFKILFKNHIFGEIMDRDKFLEDLQEKQPTILLVPEKLLREGVSEIIGVLANLSIKCISRQQNKRPSLFYVSVVLSLCRFYVYSLFERKFNYLS